MRNILQYPITIPEMVETLKRISNEISQKDEENLVCGNMDAYVLQTAADLLESLETEFNAFGLTTDTIGSENQNNEN